MSLKTLFFLAIALSLPFMILLILWLIDSVSGTWVIASIPLLIVGQICRLRWEWRYVESK